MIIITNWFSYLKIWINDGLKNIFILFLSIFESHQSLIELFFAITHNPLIKSTLCHHFALSYSFFVLFLVIIVSENLLLLLNTLHKKMFICIRNEILIDIIEVNNSQFTWNWSRVLFLGDLDGLSDNLVVLGSFWYVSLINQVFHLSN